MFLLEKTCLCPKSMSNDFSEHTYFDSKLRTFFFKYQSILNFTSLFHYNCSWSLQTIEGPLCLCPRFKMFACHKVGRQYRSQHCNSLLHNISKVQQARISSSGYETLCIVINNCACKKGHKRTRNRMMLLLRCVMITIS